MKKRPILFILFLSALGLCRAQVGTITKSKVTNDSISLMTRLILPETPLKKKPPVIIIVHGTGKEGNWNTYRPMVSRFAEQGMAVVFFDKRGTGESGGNYHEVTPANSEDVFNTLSDDVVTIAEWTKKQTHIDTARIGVLGYSEGGWVAPLAASKTPFLRFSVILSGPLCSVGQEFLFSELMGEAPDTQTMPVDSLHQKMQVFDGEPGFDSYPYVQEMEIPGLWLFGEMDTSMAVAFSQNKLKVILEEHPDKPFIYRSYPNANHSLYDITTKERKPYAQDVRAWLLKVMY